MTVSMRDQPYAHMHACGRAASCDRAAGPGAALVAMAKRKWRRNVVQQGSRQHKPRRRTAWCRSTTTEGKSASLTAAKEGKPISHVGSVLLAATRMFVRNFSLL